MSSNLQKHLTSLQQDQHSQQRLLRENERPSVMFDFKTAATVSLSKIKDLALEGFSQVSVFLPEVIEFKTFLFETEEYLSLDRFKLTERDNQELHVTLTRLICLLSQFLTNSNVLKIYEYLIRNFDIHKFESEIVLLAHLQFHSTPTFIHLVQNIDIDKKGHWVNCLGEWIRAGRVIDQDLLLTKVIVHHPSLLYNVLECTLTHMEMRKGHQREGYYLSNTRGRVEEPSSFRFLIVMVIKLMESRRTVEVVQLAKKILWVCLEKVANESLTSLLDGCVLLIYVLVNSGSVQSEETTGILVEMLEGISGVSEEIRLKIVRLFVSLCSLRNFTLGPNCLRILKTENQSALLCIFKEHLCFGFAFKFLDWCIESNYSEIPSETLELLASVTSSVFNHERVLVDHESHVKLLVNKMGLLIGHFLAKDISGMRTVVILRESISGYNGLFLVSILNVVRNQPSILKSLKLTFGHFSSYGVFELEAEGRVRYVTADSMSDCQKDNLYQSLVSTFKVNQVDLKIEERHNLLKVFLELFSKEDNLELSMKLLQLLKDLRLESAALSKCVEMYVKRMLLFHRKRCSSSSDPLVNPLTSFSSNKYLRTYVHMCDYICDFKRETSRSGKSVSFEKQLFEVDFDDLTMFVSYFSSWESGREALFQLFVESLGSLVSIAGRKDGSEEVFSSQVLTFVRVMHLFPFYSERRPEVESLVSTFVQNSKSEIDALRLLSFIESLSSYSLDSSKIISSLATKCFTETLFIRLSKDSLVEVPRGLELFCKNLKDVHLIPLLDALLLLFLKNYKRLPLMIDSVSPMVFAFDETQIKSAKDAFKLRTLKRLSAFVSKSGITRHTLSDFLTERSSKVEGGDRSPEIKLINLLDHLLSLSFDEEILIALTEVLKSVDDSVSNIYLDKLTQTLRERRGTVPLSAKVLPVYLIKRDYESFLEVLDLVIEHGGSKAIGEISSEIKGALSNSQDYVKIITLVKLWRAGFYFDLTDIDFRGSELSHLLTVLVAEVIQRGHSMEESSVFVEVCMKIRRLTNRPEDLSEVFSLLEVAWRFTSVSGVEGQFIDHLCMVVSECLEKIKEARAGFQVSMEDTSIDTEEENPRILSLDVVTSRLGISVPFQFGSSKTYISENGLKLNGNNLFGMIQGSYESILDKASRNLDRRLERETEGDDGSPILRSYMIFKVLLSIPLLLVKCAHVEMFEVLLSVYEHVLDVSVRSTSLSTDLINLLVSNWGDISHMSLPGQSNKLFRLSLLIFKKNESIESQVSFCHAVNNLKSFKSLVQQARLVSSTSITRKVSLVEILFKHLSPKKSKSLIVVPLLISLLSLAEMPDLNQMVKFVNEVIYSHASTSPSDTFSKVLLSIVSEMYQSYAINEPSFESSELSLMCSKESREVGRTLEVAHRSDIDRETFLVVINLLVSEALRKKGLVKAVKDLGTEKGTPESIFSILIFVGYVYEIKCVTGSRMVVQTLEMVKEALLLSFPVGLLTRSFARIFEKFNKPFSTLESLHFLSGLILIKSKGKLERSSSRDVIEAASKYLQVIASRRESLALSTLEKRAVLRLVDLTCLVGKCFPQMLEETLGEDSGLVGRLLSFGDTTTSFKITLGILRLVCLLCVNLRNSFVKNSNQMLDQLNRHLHLIHGIDLRNQTKVADGCIKGPRSEYRLAAIVNVVKSLIEHAYSFVEPSFSELFLNVLLADLSCSSSLRLSRVFIQDISKHVDIRTCHQEMRQILKTVQELQIIELVEPSVDLLNLMVLKMDPDTFVERKSTIWDIVISAINLGILCDTPSAPFVDLLQNFLINGEEEVLRHFIIKLRKWTSSSKEVSLRERRTIILVKTISSVVQKLGVLVLFLYGEVFDVLLDSLEQCVSYVDYLERTGRLSQETLMACLDCLGHLESSNGKSFLDNYKYELLSDVFVRVLSKWREVRDKETLVSLFRTRIIPVMVSLTRVTSNEHSVKHLLQKMIQVSKSQERLTRLLSVETMHQVIQSEGHAFHGLVNDLLPSLSTLLGDVDDEVSLKTREIVTELEQLTGENIDELIAEGCDAFDV